MLPLQSLEGTCASAGLNRAQHQGLCAGWQQVENVLARLTASKREHEARLVGTVGRVASLCVLTLQAQSECKSKWMLNQCGGQVTSISSEPE